MGQILSQAQDSEMKCCFLTTPSMWKLCGEQQET